MRLLPAENIAREEICSLRTHLWNHYSPLLESYLADPKQYVTDIIREAKGNLPEAPVNIWGVSTLADRVKESNAVTSLYATPLPIAKLSDALRVHIIFKNTLRIKDAGFHTRSDKDESDIYTKYIYSKRYIRLPYVQSDFSEEFTHFIDSSLGDFSNTPEWITAVKHDISYLHASGLFEKAESIIKEATTYRWKTGKPIRKGNISLNCKVMDDKFVPSSKHITFSGEKLEHIPIEMLVDVMHFEQFITHHPEAREGKNIRTMMYDYFPETYQLINGPKQEGHVLVLEKDKAVSMEQQKVLPKHKIIKPFNQQCQELYKEITGEELEWNMQQTVGDILNVPAQMKTAASR